MYPTLRMAKNEQASIVKDRTLKGHRSGIRCIAISSDGSSILSGDDDANLFVWDIKTGEIAQQISTPFNGAIGAIVWITLEGDGQAFAFGCADGSIQIYKERKNSRCTFDFVSMAESQGPIECLAFDFTHRRLGSVGGGCLQIWSFSENGSLLPLNEDRVAKSVVAKTVDFTDDGNSVIVCYLESHEISCYTVEPWSLKWTKLVPTRIGHACICAADGAFLYVSNLRDGVDQYRFPTLEKVQAFTHPITINMPLQLATAARGQWIVCGGDSGFARVFNRRTGQIHHILDHCEKNQAVQTVATHEMDDRTLIITGASGQGECDLQIWYERVYDPPPLPGALRESSNTGESNFFSTAKTILVYTFVAVFAMELLIGGSLYLFWPAIKPALETLLNKPPVTVHANVAATSVTAFETPPANPVLQAEKTIAFRNMFSQDSAPEKMYREDPVTVGAGTTISVDPTYAFRETTTTTTSSQSMRTINLG